MSIYSFAPSASRNLNIPFATWDETFSPDELDRIENFCATLETHDGMIDGENSNNAIRSSKTGWIRNTKETEWFYERMAFVARKINAQFYGFDLFGFVEDMQYTVYEGDASGHYAWHIDFSDTAAAPRKLSLVLQLSDPAQYEGGELQTMNMPESTTVDKKRGLVAAFPSWTLHRVTPVTSGTRKTIVVWVAGPEFK